MTAGCKADFIQADLDNDVYMKLLDGCRDKSGEIVKLKQFMTSNKLDASGR